MLGHSDRLKASVVSFGRLQVVLTSILVEVFHIELKSPFNLTVFTNASNILYHKEK